MQLQRQPGSPEGWIDSGQTMLDGPERQALRQAAAALDHAERHMRPHEMGAALAQLGCCYRGLRAHSAAEDAFGQALRWARASASVDLQVELLCDLAETACALAEELAEDEPRSAHAARERARAAPTFPPHGLYLSGIRYDTRWQLPGFSTMIPLLP